MLCLCGKSKSNMTDSKPWSRESDTQNTETQLAVLGAPGVGKTGRVFDYSTKSSAQMSLSQNSGISSALCQRFLRRTEENGVVTKIEEVDGEVSPLRIVEIATEFPFKHRAAPMRQAILNSDGFILVYSVTDRRSLHVVQQLFSYILHVRRDRDLPVVLVGNKVDAIRERRLSEEEGRSAAFDLGVSFYESSAMLSHTHVVRVFHDCVRQVRCVRIRLELKRDRKMQQESNSSGLGLCGARGLVDRISFRSRGRKKVIVNNMIG